MKICFIDPTNIEYSFKDINDPKIRGAESIFINLSKTLSENGNQIFIFSNCKDEYLSQSYSWTNISKIHNFKNNFDIVISNNDTQILDIIDCKKKFVISHSVQSIEKSLRKKQFFLVFCFWRPGAPREGQGDPGESQSRGTQGSQGPQNSPE